MFTKSNLLMSKKGNGKVAPSVNNKNGVSVVQIDDSAEMDEDGNIISKLSPPTRRATETAAERKLGMSTMIQDFDEKKKEHLRIQYTKLRNLGSFDDIIIALDKETLVATDEFELRIDEDEQPILYMDDYLISMFSYLDVAGDGYDGKIGSRQLRLLEKVFPEDSGFSRHIFPKQEDIDFVTFHAVMKEWIDTPDAKEWTKKKYKTEDVQKVPEFAMWCGQAEEYDFNPTLLLCFLFLHISTAAAYAIYWRSSTKYTLILLLICVGYNAYNTPNFIQQLKTAERRLFGVSSIFLPAMLTSFLLLILNFVIGSITFYLDPLVTTTAEQLFPWFVCIFVTIGFSIITLFSNAETSRLARKRDAYLLDCIPVVTVPKELPGEMLNETLQTAAQVLVVLYRNVGRDQIVRDNRYYNIHTGRRRVLMRVSFFAFGALIAVFYNLFVYNYPNVLSSETSWTNIYQPAWQALHGTDKDSTGYAWYLVMTIFGSLSTLCSTLCLEYGINLYTTRPFRESKLLMEYLQACTDSAEARHFFVPYIPLYEKENVKVFLNIWSFLFKHQHKGTLNQGAAGLAGVMLIDFVLVTALAVQYFFPTIAPSACVMLIEFFYAGVLTYSAAYQLFFAVRINKTFEDIGHRMSEWQAKILFDVTDQEKGESLFDILKDTKKIMTGAFEDVKILGIPATAGLVQGCGGYILTAIGFILVSIVKNYGKE